MHPDETVEFYDASISAYFEEWKDNGLLLPQLRALLVRLPPRPTILDLGCGPGCESKRLVELGANVIGIDLSSISISMARRHVPEAQFFQMDVRQLSFQPESFDAVLEAAVLFHFDDAEQHRILSSIRRIVRADGLLLSIYHTGDYQGIQERIVQGVRVRRHLNQKSISAWSDMVCSEGFEVAALPEAVLGPFWAALFSRKDSSELSASRR